jgi:hypothetical protein
LRDQSKNLLPHFWALCIKKHLPKVHSQITEHLVQRPSVIEKKKEFARSTTDCGRQRTERILGAEPDILDLAKENPSISVRRLTYRVRVSPFVVWRKLNEQRLHPYHVQNVQSLEPENFPRRLTFRQRLLQKNNEETQLMERLLTTDETIFTRNGIFNGHNTHISFDENPHAIRQTEFQDLVLTCGQE